MKLRATVTVLAVAGSWLVAAGPGLPQALETYALPHLFALPTATTTRLFGMGGFVTCIKDEGFPNPAFAGTLQASHAVGRLSLTDFDSGLRLRGLQFSAAGPVEANGRGWQVTGFDLDSSAGIMTTPAGPVLAAPTEEELAIHYGCRVSENWIVGMGISPIFRTATALRNPLTGDALAHIKSKAEFGFRVGALYQLDSDGWAGLIFDMYDEDVTATTPLGRAAAAFDSTEIALGVSRQLSDCALGAIEWQQLTVKGAGVKHGDAGIRVGVEVQPRDDWAVRVGSNDGALSLGLGAAREDWSFDYAYIKDWNDDSVRAYLGSSDTHQFEIQHRWHK